MSDEEKRRKRKPSALAEKVLTFVIDILSAILAGLATAAILRLFGW